MDRAVGEEGVRPGRVERVDLVVARAVDHACSPPDAIIDPLGAGEARVGEVVGPGTTAAADWLDDAIDGQAIDLREVNPPLAVVSDRLGTALRDDQSVGRAVGDRRDADLAADRRGR